MRLVIVDNDSAYSATLAYLERCGHLVVPGPGAFNFSRLVNLGVAAAGAVDHVLLLNNDVVSARPGWLQALLEHSQRTGIGAVGARLLFDDGTPQHEGIRVGARRWGRPSTSTFQVLRDGATCRTVSAVTGACLMVKRPLWEEVGGFDEALRVAFNDVDFCLRLLRAGYRNVYTPLAELTHLESATRGRRHPVEDERLFVTRWGPFPQGFDRYIGAISGRSSRSTTADRRTEQLQAITVASDAPARCAPDQPASTSVAGSSAMRRRRCRPRPVRAARAADPCAPCSMKSVGQPHADQAAR